MKMVIIAITITITSIDAGLHKITPFSKTNKKRADSFDQIFFFICQNIILQLECNVWHSAWPWERILLDLRHWSHKPEMCESEEGSKSVSYCTTGDYWPWTLKSSTLRPWDGLKKLLVQRSRTGLTHSCSSVLAQHPKRELRPPPPRCVFTQMCCTCP